MSPDPDFAWLDEIITAARSDGEVVRAGDVTVVVRGCRDGDALITSRPECMGGTRAFRGTRLPVEALWDYLEDGKTIDGIFDSYPTLFRADVLSVIERGLR